MPGPVIPTEKKPSKFEAYSSTFDLIPQPMAIAAGVRISPRLAKVLREYVMDTLPSKLPVIYKNVLNKVKNIGLTGGVNIVEEPESIRIGAYKPLNSFDYKFYKSIGSPQTRELVLSAREDLKRRLADTTDYKEALRELALSRGTEKALTFNRPLLYRDTHLNTRPVYHELTHLGQDLEDPGTIITLMDRYGDVSKGIEAYRTNPLEIGANIGEVKRAFKNNPTMIAGHLTRNVISKLTPRELDAYSTSMRQVPMTKELRDVLSRVIQAYKYSRIPK